MVPFILAGMVALAGAYGGFKWWQVEQFRRDREQAVAADMTGPPVTEFELTDRSGEPFRSAEMRGKVWVVTYFFSTCPGNCIRLNQNIKYLHNLPELADVTWVSITCDPATDTLDALTAYADHWNADPDRWLFVRGDLDYIQQIGAGMKLPVYRQGHRDEAVVFDKAGNIRGMFNGTRQSETQQLRTRLLECLAEEIDDASAGADSEDTVAVTAASPQ
jgi:cytochrome oxidase Cu insertion factor (SCO1/SenC/PrrC family)